MVIKELRKATNTVVYRTFEMVMLWVVATYNSACVAMEIKNTKTSSALTATDLIVGQGYTAELHSAWTEDGFELGIHRIAPLTTGARTVFMLHGVFTNAGCWVANLPFNDLAFMLHDSGFDVWIGNVRGTKYSTTNSMHGSHEEEYWDWSWPEIGAIDLTTMVNYVLNYTGQPQLTLVCHSEGCSDSFSALSTLPYFTKKIGFFLALAPAAFVADSTQLFVQLGAILNVGDLLYDLRIWHVNGLGTVGDVLTADLCELLPDVCALTFEALFGWDFSNANASRMDIYCQLSDDTSTHNIQHGFQAVDTGRFAYYDYGEAVNEEIYGQASVPDIPLDQITLPMALYYGGADSLVTQYDVEEYLLPALSNADWVMAPKLMPTWNHMDFVISMNGTEYWTMEELIDTYGP